MCHLVPFNKLPCAKTLAKAFVKEIVRLHGVPMDIVFDRGSQFVAHFWHAFCDRIKIGATVPEEESFSGNLDKVWTNVRHNLKEENRWSKKYFDKKRSEALFAVGNIVWLSSRNLHLKIPSKKLGSKFVGPFKVVQVVNLAAVRLDIPSSWRINSVFHVYLLKKVDTPDKEAMPTVPTVDDDGEFEISWILDSRWHRGSLQYLVSWKGFSPKDNSWVKAEDVSASRLIKAFHKRFPNKARPRGSGGSS
ncbi:unnamed protein product [Ranitomeya imitator]|uniref:Chromo domain-containing protein n=1 Tax=Ranitomeya imitator TaxID=111125 RepID=A0ABN9LI97_9NEOB|nr:unnamed protein product [Ranitomeya imitator]